MRLLILNFCLLFAFLKAQGPIGLTSTQIPFIKSGQSLSMGDFGGLNAPQFQEVDFNGDGHLDLVILERIGNYVAYLEWNPLNSQYEVASGWGNSMPLIQNWFQLEDYNCDGAIDLFASANGGIEVYQNTGTNTNPNFILEKELLYSSTNGSPSNLFIFSSDITAMEDMDGDQDLDILTFSLNNNEFVELHLNQSQELGYGCDSLIYELHTMCWGQFRENSLDNAISLNENCDAPESPPVRHAGSSLALLDYDGNGALDLLLGDISFPELKLLMNNGTSVDAVINSVVDQFPVVDPVTLYNYPAAYLIDVNHDNKKDLIVASANRSLYNNFEGIWYYENVAASGYDFQFQKEDLFQQNMIDVGEGALVHFEDLNGDGLGDILLTSTLRSDGNGMSEYPVVYYQNTGTATQPEFTWVTDDFGNLSTFSLNAAPQCTWGDLNNDNKKDLIIGNIDGSLQFLVNTGTNANPVYAMAQNLVLDQLSNPIDVGQFASPILVDMDNDGDLDLLIGNKTGNVAFYRNNGNNSSATWTLVSATWKDINVKETFDLYGYSTLHYQEIGGVHYLSIGSFSGNNYVYAIQKAASPELIAVDHQLNNQFVGTRTKAVLANLNNDAFPDAFVSNYRGGINSYLGATYSSAVELEDNQFKIYPNPSKGELKVSGASLDGSEMRIFNMMGAIVYQNQLKAEENTFNLAHFESGVYLIQCIKNDQMFSFRWIKE